MQSSVRTWLLLFLTLMLVGCVMPSIGGDSNRQPDSVSPQTPAGDVCTVDRNSSKCICLEQGETSPACMCARGVSPTACGICETASATRLRIEAQKALGQGQYDAGDIMLRCALQKNSRDQIARVMLQQLEDPTGFLTSHSSDARHKYRVRPGETLGSIALDCLGNALYFVGLARINNIDDPAALRAGEYIVVPGTACRAEATPEPPVAGSFAVEPVPQRKSPSDIQPLEQESVAVIQSTDASVPDTADVPLAAEVLLDKPKSEPAGVLDSTLPDQDFEAGIAQESETREISGDEEIVHLLEEFTELVSHGDLDAACVRVEAILEIDRFNEDALLNKESFCE